MEFYDDGVYYYQGLPDDLDNLKSYDAIKSIIDPPLTDNQSVDLLKALLFKRTAILYSTGLGKTYLATAFVKALMNKKGNTKTLMFVLKSQEDETPRKIKNISGLRTKMFTGETRPLLNSSDIDNNDVIMMSHSCLTSLDHMDNLLAYINKFDCLIIDEVHKLTNFETSISGFMLYSIAYSFEYVLALTATPITTDLEQFARLLKLVVPNQTGNFRKLGSSLKRSGLGALTSSLHDNYIVRERDISHHNGIADFIKPMPHQVGADGRDLFKITKGPGAYKQANRVFELINERRPRKGIIYANITEIREFLLEELKKRGVKVEGIFGNTKKEDRARILEKFNNNGLETLIINTKESLDMNSDYVIFYEYTPHVKQVIGRAERGFNMKPLDVIWMFTEDTGEWDSFIRNQYNISQDIQEILGTDLRDVLQLRFNRGDSNVY